MNKEETGKKRNCCWIFGSKWKNHLLLCTHKTMREMMTDMASSTTIAKNMTQIALTSSHTCVRLLLQLKLVSSSCRCHSLQFRLSLSSSCLTCLPQSALASSSILFWFKNPINVEGKNRASKSSSSIVLMAAANLQVESQCWKVFSLVLGSLFDAFTLCLLWDDKWLLSKGLPWQTKWWRLVLGVVETDCVSRMTTETFFLLVSVAAFSLFLCSVSAVVAWFLASTSAVLVQLVDDMSESRFHKGRSIKGSEPKKVCKWGFLDGSQGRCNMMLLLWSKGCGRFPKFQTSCQLLTTMMHFFHKGLPCY